MPLTVGGTSLAAQRRTRPIRLPMNTPLQALPQLCPPDPPRIPLVMDESLYQRLVENVSDYAIYLIDPDGYVCSWNRGAERFKGYRAEEIIGHHFSVFYTDEDRAAGMPAHVLRLAHERGRFEDRAWRVRKDGHRFRAHVVLDPVRDDDGTLIGFAKITRDISETYQQEQALRASERRFRLLVSSVTDYAIYMLDLEGHISSWNAGAERFKNYRAAEVIGRHFSLFYTPADLASGRPALALRTALSEGRFEDTGWRRRKGGATFWAHVVIDLIRDEDGTPIGFAKITRDISERRAADLRLRDLSRTNEELEQFVQVASHDLREPLRKVLAFADLLEFDLAEALSKEHRGYLNSIAGSARRMQELLESLLRLTQVTSAGCSFVPTDLKQICEDVCADLDVAIREAEAQIDIQPLPVVEGDSAQLRQVFQNLIENALKYRLASRPLQVRICEVENPDPTLVTLKVEDNGMGFMPEYNERIFGLFQRLHTRDRIAGAGVGLAICRKICQRHGGTITAEGIPEQGSQFWIVLKRGHRETEAIHV